MPAFQPSITHADLPNSLVARSLTAQMVSHKFIALAGFCSMTIEGHLEAIRLEQEIDLTWAQDVSTEGKKGAVEDQKTSRSNNSDSESEGMGKGFRLWRHMYSHPGGE